MCTGIEYHLHNKMLQDPSSSCNRDSHTFLLPLDKLRTGRAELYPNDQLICCIWESNVQYNTKGRFYKPEVVLVQVPICTSLQVWRLPLHFLPEVPPQ